MKKTKIKSMIIKKIFLIIILLLAIGSAEADEGDFENLLKEMEKSILISAGVLLLTTIFFSVVKKILNSLKMKMPRGWAVFAGIITTLLGILCVFIFKLKEPAWCLLIFPFLISFALARTYIIPVPWTPFKEILHNEVEYDIWAEKIRDFPYSLFGRVVDSDPFIPYVFRIWWIRQSRYHSFKYLYSPYINLFFAFIFFSVFWLSFWMHELSSWVIVAALMVTWLFGNYFATLKKYMDAEKLRDKFMDEANRFWNEFEDRLFDWVSSQPWVGIKYSKEKFDEKEIDSAIEKLGLQKPINETKIRMRYWELVKKYHLLTQTKKYPEEKIENEFKRILRYLEELYARYI